MTRIQWAADRGRPSTPVVPRARFDNPAPCPVKVSPYGMSFTYGEETDDPAPFMMQIVREVAKQYGLSADAIIGERRTREVIVARQHAMWRLVRAQRWSMRRIGQVLGGRDHTTICHGAKRHEQRMREATRAVNNQDMRGLTTS